MALEKAVYTAKAKATGGRDGRAVSSDGILDVQLTLCLKKWADRVAAPIPNNFLPPVIPHVFSVP